MPISLLQWPTRPCPACAAEGRAERMIFAGSVRLDHMRGWLAIWRCPHGHEGAGLPKPPDRVIQYRLPGIA